MRGFFRSRKSTLFRRVGEAFVDLVPVDDVVEGGDVVGLTVLVVEGVGVFPHVEAEDRGAFASHAGYEVDYQRLSVVKMGGLGWCFTP